MFPINFMSFLLPKTMLVYWIGFTWSALPAKQPRNNKCKPRVSRPGSPAQIAMHLNQCHPRRNIPAGQWCQYASMFHDRSVLSSFISHWFQHYRPGIFLSCLHFWLCYSCFFQLPRPLKWTMQQKPAWCINFDLCGSWIHKTVWMTWSNAFSLIIHLLAPVISP